MKRTLLFLLPLAVFGLAALATHWKGDRFFSEPPKLPDVVSKDPSVAASLIHNTTTTEYSTIQEAIDASVDGDEVVIKPGVFTEQLTITTGIILRGAGKNSTTLRSPLAADLVQTGGNWKNLKAEDIFALIGVKSSSGSVLIKDLSIDGQDQGYLPDGTRPDKSTYTFYGIASLNTSTTIDNVNISGIRELATDYNNVTVPPGYSPADQPAGMNHNESILGEGAAGSGAHTLTISNCTISKFQKTAILAWGPALTVDIHDNTIQGYGQTLYSTGNGIQIASTDRSSMGGANGNRTGTKGSVYNNQILDIGIVIPAQGNAGYYYNQWLGGSTGILLYSAGDNFEIKNNTITGSILLGTSWHNSITSSDNEGYANQAIDITNSNNAVVEGNTIKNFEAGILEEASLQGSMLTVKDNVFERNLIDIMGASGNDAITLGTGAEVLAYAKGNSGIDNITGFGAGDKIYFNDVTLAGVVNGMAGNTPSINFSGGTVSAGDGTNVAAHSIQVAAGGSSTTLYVDTDGQPGPAEVQLTLTGVYSTGNFKLNGGYIEYATPAANLVHNGNSTSYATIQSAIDAAVTGDQVLVNAGTFTEQLTITKGIGLKGAGRGITTLRSPRADSLVQTGGNWRNLKNEHIIALIGIKSPSDPVTIEELTVDGHDQGYLPDAVYPNKASYTFYGVASLNTTTTVNNVNISGIRELATDYGSSAPVPSGYEPADQPAGMNHNESILGEGAAGSGSHTLTVSNCTISKFQKTAILAWGPALTVSIHDNTIQGYGQTLYSTGNGIQIASSDRSSLGESNGDRRGTKGSIVNNQILGIGIVIPEQGNPGYYYNPGLGGSSGILLYSAGDGVEIKNNTVTGSIVKGASWHNSMTSYNSEGYSNQAISLNYSNNIVVEGNTLKDFEAGILEEAANSGSSLTVKNNVFSNNLVDIVGASGNDVITLGGDPEIIGFANGNTGTDIINGFGAGDKLYFYDINVPGVLNGKNGNHPVIDFSAGTISTGDGTNVAAHSVQVSAGLNSTTLYIDADGQAGVAEIQVTLNGSYTTGNFKLNGGYIEYASPAATLVHNGNSTEYATIQYAINAATDGDEVQIKAGTFTEQLTVTKGITLKGAGVSQTTVKSPVAASLVQSGGNWKNLKAQDVYAVIGIKSPLAAVTVQDLTVDGNDQGYLPDVLYGDKNAYAFDGIALLNTSATINNVKVTGVRELYSDYGSVVPAGYLPADQPSGMNHNEGIFAESAAGAGAHTVTITNTTVTRFQKTAILAWGPTLTVDIHDNTIQGYGKTLFSTGNGIQIASSDRSGMGGYNGDRTGTKGRVVNNQILDIGIVIPEQGQPGYYYNAGLGGSTAILLYQAGEGVEIKDNTITGSGRNGYSWHNSNTSSDNEGYANQGIDITDGKNVVIENNTIEYFESGILEESAAQGSALVVNNNSFSNNLIDIIGAGGNDKIVLKEGANIIAYQKSGNGVDTLNGFGDGDKIYLFDVTATGVVNGMAGNVPSIDFTNGTISAGDGTNVAAHSVQVTAGSDSTILFADTDGQAGAAELKIVLNGKYVVDNFKLNGAYITYMKAPAAITLSAQATKTYGDADFDAGAASNNTGTAITYQSSNTDVATIVNGKVHIVGAGTTTITASQAADDVYTAAADVQQVLTVNKAALTIAADAVSKTYGQSDPALTYQVTSGTLVTGDAFSGGLTRDAGENAGTYAIKQGTLTAGNNYSIMYTSADLTINKAAITVTADANSKVYGQSDPVFTYQVTSGAVVTGDAFSGTLTRDAGQDAGTYAIRQGTLTLGDNYALTFNTANLTVTKAALTVTADARSKVYGQSDPALTYQVTTGALISGDAFTGSLTRDAGENAGTYAIRQGTLSAGSNYMLTFGSADLTITKAAVTVTADAKSKVYGQSDPALTYQVTSGAVVSGDAFSGALTRDAGQNAGTYPIRQGTLSLGSNYTITFAGANLSITQAAITVTADAQSKVYGQNDPQLTYRVSSGALLTGDVFSGNLSRVTGENAGTYAINQGTLTAGSNYTLTYNGSVLTITAATRTITFNALPVKTYLDADFDPGAVLSSNETVIYTSSDASVATIVNGKIHITGAGTATITASAPVNNNYSATASVNRQLTVNKANQTITFASIPEQVRGAQYSLSGVRSSSGLPVTFTVGDNTIVSVQGTQLTALAIGNTTVTATAAGDRNFNDAVAVVQTVKVSDPRGEQISVRRDVSPNGDGVGDGLYIEGIKTYPKNTVTVVNRNGVKVFEVKNYDNVTNIFNGRSNITNQMQIPGAYFYIVQYVDEQGVTRRKTGYFVLKYR